MDIHIYKFYQLNFSHLNKNNQSQFKKESVFNKYLNIKEQGSKEFFNFYEENNFIIDSSSKGIFKNLNLDYFGFQLSNKKILSEKLEKKIKDWEQKPYLNNSDNNFYQEIFNLIQEILDNFNHQKFKEDLIPKYYCEICEKNFLSEKNHYLDIQKDYKFFLENFNNNIHENKNLAYNFLESFIPKKIYNFKPFELKLLPIHLYLNSSKFNEFVNLLFTNPERFLNLPTESNLSFEVIKYYTEENTFLSDLAFKINIFTIKDDYIMPDLDEKVEILKNLLVILLGESESFFSGFFTSKKKEITKRLPTGSLVSIFNLNKLSETEKKLIKEIFVNESYPKYTVKDLEPHIPDEEVKSCLFCTGKFNFVNRKHHCRICGNIFCGKCLVWTRIPYLGYLSRVRSCLGCVDKTKVELCETILNDILFTIKNVFICEPDKKSIKNKIYYLIGILKKIDNFHKWSFLAYEFLNLNFCKFSIICFIRNI